MPSAVAPRAATEEAAAAIAARGAHVSVIRLPPSVHGDGDEAFIPELIRVARDQGVSASIGDGRNCWPAVHRLDAARLFVLALHNAAAHATYHGVGDQGVAIRDIAAAIGARLEVPVVGKPAEDAVAHFGAGPLLLTRGAPTPRHAPVRARSFGRILQGSVQPARDVGHPARVLKPSLAWRRVAVYLVLVVAFSGIFDAVIIHLGELGAGHGLYVYGLMWSPALAALATCKITGVPLASLGLRWPAWRHILAAWLVPLGYTVVAYTIVWVSGLGGVPDLHHVDELAKSFGMTGWPAPAILIVQGMLAGVFAMPGAVAHGLGEELGWRGFLVPQLSKVMGFGGVVVVTGVIWTAYHIPVLVFANYNSGTPWWFGLSCFTVLVFSGGAIFAASRLRSGSVWPAAILHGSHNLFIQGVFTPMTRDTGYTRWIIDEFGVALAVVVTVFAIVICRGMTRTAREYRAAAGD